MKGRATQRRDIPGRVWMHRVDGRFRAARPRREAVGAVLLTLVCLPSLVAAQAVPAARRLDPTNHGGTILQGSPTVSIGGQPAARLGDFASCPLACPGGSPHAGGPIASGSTTVFIDGLRAARVGSVVSETCAAATVANGSTTVRIGP